MKQDLKIIKEGLIEKGFKVTYEIGKHRYSITKVGNPLERLCVQEEGLLDKGVDGIVSEYNKMVSFFRQREDFLKQIEGKSVKELTFEEFRTIRHNRIPHDGVSKAYKKFWDSLNSKEKNHIRNEYDDVAEYIYSKVTA